MFKILCEMQVWKWPWRLTYRNWENQFIAISMKQAEHCRLWGICVRFWCEKYIQRWKIHCNVNFYCWFSGKLLLLVQWETYRMWSSYRKVFVLSYCTVLARKPTICGHHTERFLYWVIALSWPGNLPYVVIIQEGFCSVLARKSYCLRSY